MWGLIGLGAADLFGGRPTGARKHLATAVDLARGLRAPHHEAEALALLGHTLLLGGEHDAAIARLREALDLVRRTGLPLESLVLAYLADALDRAGGHGAALSSARGAIEVVRRRGSPWLDISARNVLGTLLCRQGDAGSALAWHEGTRRRAETSRDPYGTSEAHLGPAGAWLRAHDPEAAAQHARKGLSLACTHGFTLHQAIRTDLMARSGAHGPD
ncbi:tetratricopeptide repeat protein [Streptomyces sp. NPDC059679]|uniref:tetratricopeptide repeat protein n=1 Tax=Streptomyces sp. NPDC059679 TaxID=3346903 RepID=UPI0036BF27D6